MKINAIIESRDGGTLVLDFPRSIYDVYEKLQSVGIRQSPHKITLSDEDGDDVRVKLYSEDEIGKHQLFTQGINARILVPEHKDWNEDLLYLNQEENEVKEPCQVLQL